MKLVKLMSIGHTAIPVASAFPSAQYGPSEASTSFFLKVNALHQPWNNRHLVILPITQRLGLENLTIHPVTPPVSIKPVHLLSNAYGLGVSNFGDDLSKTPYIAALQDHNHSFTPDIVELQIVHAPSPTNFTDCPRGYKCVADRFIIYEDGGTKLAYGGFKGSWTVDEDAGSDGWHVYWRDDGKSDSGAIELEMVSQG